MTELNLPLEEQLHGFLIAVAAGVLLGALYDAVRVYRILMRPPKRQVFFLDTAVLVLCSFLTFLTALASCSGVLRFYLFLGKVWGGACMRLPWGRLPFGLLRRFCGFWNDCCSVRYDVWPLPERLF